MLFDYPVAASKFQNLKSNTDFIKKMKKAAKMHVLEMQENALARQGVEKIEEKKVKRNHHLGLWKKSGTTLKKRC
jgi:hypothetical protein